MDIQCTFEHAGALKKTTVEKEEGDFIIIFQDKFPIIEYNAKNLQYPTKIGEDIDFVNDTLIDGMKRDEAAIKYLEELLKQAREEAVFRLFKG